jgi:hypothetical protein
MAMVVISMIVGMAVSVMCVSKGCEAYDVNEKAENTDNQELVQSLQFMTFPQALERIEDDLYTDKPKLC